MPQGSDDNWSRKLYSNFVNKHDRFAKPRFSNSAFIVHHFADNVDYNSNGFLQKNRDAIFEDQVLLLRSSKVNSMLFSIVFVLLPLTLVVLYINSSILFHNRNIIQILTIIKLISMLYLIIDAVFYCHVI